MSARRKSAAHELRPAGRLRRTVVALLIVAVAGAVLWSQLPRTGFSTDLSLIGAGRPALVLAFDHFYVAGGEMMVHLDTLRGEYGERVEFLVADMSTPEGRDFARRQGVGDGTALLFDHRGARVAALLPPQDAVALRQALEAAFFTP